MTRPTRYTRQLPNNPSRRAVRNAVNAAKALYAPEIYGAVVEVEQAPPPRKRGSYESREESSNDALKAWRIARPDVRMWRNNVGVYQYANGKFLRYGLCNGSSDFVGLHSLIIKPEHVGKRVAVFLAIESKARGKDAEEHQETWLREVMDAGAIAGVARNADEADALIETWGIVK